MCELLFLTEKKIKKGQEIARVKRALSQNPPPLPGNISATISPPLTVEAVMEIHEQRGHVISRKHATAVLIPAG